VALRHDQEEVLLETLCFHAQQAVEKSLKAVLLHRGVAFPGMHSIERLIDLLPGDVPRPEHLLASADLTAYATVLRYPGEMESVTRSQYQEAVDLATAAVNWAEELVARCRG
jgi:HEPN domain-containing protein